MQKFIKSSKNKFILSLLLSLVLVLGFSTQITLADKTKEPAKTVDILTFNDFHGNVEESGKNPGMAKLVAYIREKQKDNPNTIVVSGGDLYQGTAISNLTYGEPVTEMMKAMNVVASAVGNHEFDWGAEKIEKWGKDGGFDFLATNIYDKKTGEPVTWAKPYKIVEKAGIKIGFIGLAHPDTLTLTKEQYIKDFDFKDPVKSAEEWIKYLKDGKAEEGVPDVIIALTHIDTVQDSDTKEIEGKAIDLTKVEGMDAVISAHSHRTVCGIVNDVPIVQGYSNGRAVGKLSIKLDENNKVMAIEPEVDEIYTRVEELPIDKEAEEILNKYKVELEPILGEVIGEASDAFIHDKTVPNVTTLGRWTCEIMREKTGADIAITNGGGLRRTLEKGPITMGDMYEIMPFDNTFITLDLKGEDVKKAIDHGILNPEVGDGQFVGLIVEYDESKEFENRITKITLEDGTPLDMNKNYKVVINDFMYPNGDKYDFSRAENVVNTFIPIRDALVDAIKEAKVITPKEADYLIEVKDIKVEEPVKEPEVAVQEDKPVEKPEVVVPAAKEENYVVKSGDVLWKIAKKFKTTWQTLAEYNKLKNPHLIFPGQKILIPAK